MPRFWVDTNASLTVTSAGGQSSLITTVGLTNSRFLQATLLRTIIGFDIAHAVHDSGEGSQLFSIGIGISGDTVTAGSLPDPEDDADFPPRGWIWKARYRIWGFAADQPAVFTRRVDLDIRAMRKLDNGEGFMIATNADNEGVASAITVRGLIRQLWLVG